MYQADFDTNGSKSLIYNVYFKTILHHTIYQEKDFFLKQANGK